MESLRRGVVYTETIVHLAPARFAADVPYQVIIAKLDDGGKTVKYLDIGDKFLDAEKNLPKDIMPDSLHPNAKGYQIWAEAILPTVKEMMK